MLQYIFFDAVRTKQHDRTDKLLHAGMFNTGKKKLYILQA